MNQQPTFRADAVSAAYERGRAQALNATGREALSSINEKLGNIVMWIEHVTELPDVDLWIAEAKADYASDASMGEDEADARVQQLREAAQERIDNTLSLTEAYEKSRPQLLDIVQDLGSYSGDELGVGADEREGRAQIKRRLDIHLDSAGLGTLSE